MLLLFNKTNVEHSQEQIHKRYLEKEKGAGRLYEYWSYTWYFLGPVIYNSNVLFEFLKISLLVHSLFVIYT